MMGSLAKLFIFVTLFPSAIVAVDCINQYVFAMRAGTVLLTRHVCRADPDHGIGNYCYCFSTNSTCFNVHLDIVSANYY